jgi:hypothetical protein
MRAHLAQEIIEIPGLSYDLDSSVVKKARESGPQKQRIFPEDYSHGATAAGLNPEGLATISRLYSGGGLWRDTERGVTDVRHPPPHIVRVTTRLV